MCTNCGRDYCYGCGGISPHILPLQAPPYYHAPPSYYHSNTGPSLLPVLLHILMTAAAYTFLVWAIYNFIRAVAVAVYRLFRS